MNDTTSLLLSVCAVLVVVGGLLALGAFLVLRFLARRTRGLPVGAFGALGSAFRSESAADVDAPVSGQHHRVNLRDLASGVDFDAALARQSDSNPTANVSAQQAQPPQPDLKRGAINSGQVLRSGHTEPERPPDSKPVSPRRPDDLGLDGGFQRIGGDSLPSDFDTPPEPPLRRRRRRGDLNNEHEDEIFGGMLDEDGDGEVDF